MTTSIKVGDAPRVAPWRTDCWWEALALEKPYFSYLMVNDCKTTKTHSYVGKDKKPKKKVERHNSGEVRNPRARSTKGAVGHWKLNMVLGPFEDKDKAISVRDEWQADCRGIASRRKKGMDLARKYEVTCFDSELDKMEEEEED